MADRYFINSGIDISWDHTYNWSTSSGGRGGASAPGSSDTAIFDTNSPSCVVALNTTIGTLISDWEAGVKYITMARNLTVNSSYGNLDVALFDSTFGKLILDGTITCTSSDPAGRGTNIDITSSSNVDGIITISSENYSLTIASGATVSSLNFVGVQLNNSSKINVWSLPSGNTHPAECTGYVTRFTGAEFNDVAINVYGADNIKTNSDLAGVMGRIYVGPGGVSDTLRLQDGYISQAGDINNLVIDDAYKINQTYDRSNVTITKLVISTCSATTELNFNNTFLRGGGAANSNIDVDGNNYLTIKGDTVMHNARLKNVKLKQATI